MKGWSVFVTLAGLLGCPRVPPAVQSCRAVADAEFLSRVRAECAGQPFDTCSAHDRLVADHDRNLEGCSQ